MSGGMCVAASCDRVAYKRSECSMHYNRRRRFGSYDLPRQPTPEQRFWAKVDKSTHSCWRWTGASGTHGYGNFSPARGQFQLAHRYSVSLVEALIPRLTVDHLCRVRLCVRPNHLEQVTLAENIRRAMSFRTRITACVHGHEYTPENTFINVNGYRECSTCIRTRNASRGLAR